MEYMEIISIPVIATIVYWIINMLKAVTKNNETFKKFIPIVSGGLGAVLGVVLFYATPNAIAASNVLVAIMSGAASGLTATGCNQIFKQLCNDNKDVNTIIDDLLPKDKESEEKVEEKKEENSSIDVDKDNAATKK